MVPFPTRSVCAAALSLACFPISAQVAFDVIAADADPAPGFEPGDTFRGITDLFGIPVINNAGDVAFSALVSGNTGGFNNTGIWSTAGGSLALVAREEFPAPGTAGERFYDFDQVGDFFSRVTPIVLTETGEVVFRGRVVTGSSHQPNPGNSVGLWAQSGGEVIRIARDETPVAGIPNAVYFDLFPNQLQSGSQGETIFSARILSGNSTPVKVNSLNDTAIWSWNDGTQTLLVREGDAAPGVLDGFFGDVTSAFAYGSSGHIAIANRMVGDGVDDSNNDALFVGLPGELRLVARQGDVAPGTGGASYQQITAPLDAAFGGLQVSSEGLLTFSATLSGVGVDATNDTGIWAERTGGIELVVREGDAVPGGVLRELRSAYYNDAGMVAFAGRVSTQAEPGAVDSAIWIATDDGGLQLVAQEGQGLPGTPGFVIDHVGIASLNESGQVLYSTSDRPVGGGGTSRSWWIADTDGSTQLLVRDGDLVDMDSDPLVEDLQAVFNIEVNDIFSRNTGFFNDHGQVAFRVPLGNGLASIMRLSLLDLDPGDVTGDGLVGVEDLDILLANWGDAVGVRAQSSGDLSGDGVVGQADLDLLIAHWGEGEIPDINIPEPGTFALLGVGIVTLARRRRAA